MKNGPSSAYRYVELVSVPHRVVHEVASHMSAVAKDLKPVRSAIVRRTRAMLARVTATRKRCATRGLWLPVEKVLRTRSRRPLLRSDPIASKLYQSPPSGTRGSKAREIREEDSQRNNIRPRKLPDNCATLVPVCAQSKLRLQRGHASSLASCECWTYARRLAHQGIFWPHRRRKRAAARGENGRARRNSRRAISVLAH